MPDALCFHVRQYVRASVCASVRDVVSAISVVCMHALMDSQQTFVSCASWDREELIRFWGQKVKGQGPSVTKGQHAELDALCTEF